MYKIITRIAAVAAIALAAVPVVAVGAANAATRPTRVSVSEINFSRADHLAAFNARVSAAQRHFCATGQKRPLADNMACRQAVREEIVSQLTGQQRMALGVAEATHG